jgi:hypothetical protein
MGMLSLLRSADPGSTLSLLLAIPGLNILEREWLDHERFRHLVYTATAWPAFESQVVPLSAAHRLDSTAGARYGPWDDFVNTAASGALCLAAPVAYPQFVESRCRNLHVGHHRGDRNSRPATPYPLLNVRFDVDPFLFVATGSLNARCRIQSSAWSWCHNGVTTHTQIRVGYTGERLRTPTGHPWVNPTALQRIRDSDAHPRRTPVDVRGRVAADS